MWCGTITLGEFKALNTKQQKCNEFHKVIKLQSKIVDETFILSKLILYLKKYVLNALPNFQLWFHLEPFTFFTFHPKRGERYQILVHCTSEMGSIFSLLVVGLFWRFTFFTIFQSYCDLEAGDTQSLKCKRRDRDSNPDPLLRQPRTRPPPLQIYSLVQ